MIFAISLVLCLVALFVMKRVLVQTETAMAWQGFIMIMAFVFLVLTVLFVNSIVNWENKLCDYTEEYIAISQSIEETLSYTEQSGENSKILFNKAVKYNKKASSLQESYYKRRNLFFYSDNRIACIPVFNLDELKVSLKQADEYSSCDGLLN